MTLRTGTLNEKSLLNEKLLPRSPAREKKNSWKKLAENLHSRRRDRRNNVTFAMELGSETDRFDGESDAVSLTFQSAQSEMTEQEEHGVTVNMPVSSLLDPGWEQQSKRDCTSVSNDTIEALPSIPPRILRKERIVQQTDMAMDPAGIILYDFLGFSGKSQVSAQGPTWGQSSK